jgi:hypothetical protein
MAASERQSSNAEITMALLGQGQGQEEVKAENLFKSDQFLNQAFLVTTTKVFRDACTAAGFKAGAKDGFPDLMKKYLQPMTEYMADLKIDQNTVSGRTKNDRNFNGLLDLIAQTKQQFKKDNNDAMSWSGMRQMMKGFDTILKQTKDQVRSQHGEFADEHNRPIKQAQLARRNARLKKTVDFCCIAACAGWLPLENVMTVGNCFGCGSNCMQQNSRCCTAECGDIPENGGIHLFAPVGSIKSLASDWSAQDGIIDANKPAVMRMI